MSDNNSGIGFFGALTITFIVLKLCHVISWSWWWVLAPIWGGIAIALLFVLGTLSIPFLVMGIIVILSGMIYTFTGVVRLFKALLKRIVDIIKLVL